MKPTQVITVAAIAIGIAIVWYEIKSAQEKKAVADLKSQTLASSGQVTQTPPIMGQMPPLAQSFVQQPMENYVDDAALKKLNYM